MSLHHGELGVSMDLSHMPFSRADLDGLAPKIAAALAAMQGLENGDIANPDEKRMVGHYWLRHPGLAPTDAIRDEIQNAQGAVTQLAGRVLRGEIKPASSPLFEDAVVVGIGGSSLGPMLVYDALRGLGPRQGLRLHFLDNTDPDGVDRIVADLDLARTLSIVISKSGGTKETRNGMLEMQAAYAARGLALGPHAVAVTSEGSKLHAFANEHGFLAQLPMWDWVGGRTSVTSPVGLLPAALAGLDVPSFLEGAASMDALTRGAEDNPAAWLAAAWYLAGDGHGKRNMVLLPYKDRLALTSRYLQQLVMESLGKRDNLAGETVHQGLTVYGNKGSTDQHAYVQQLLDGPDDFFVTFIEVLRDRESDSVEVEPGVTSGDYLSGFLQGTRRALHDRGRGSITLSFEVLDAHRMGAIIALYERAVGLYATLIGVNAYHQPAVESGKRAAAAVLGVQADLLEQLGAEGKTAEALAKEAGTDDVVTALSVLRHLAANGRAKREGGGAPWEWTFKRP
jgi:glucose-6-phosphate isomerase